MVILVDMDGVIVDFEEGFLRGWRKRYPKLQFVPLERRKTQKIKDNYPAEYSSKIEDIYNKPGFYKTLKAIPQAVEALTIMQQLVGDVFICSTPLSKNPKNMQERYDWIRRYLGEFWTRRLILTSDKTLIRGDILIDDWVRTGLYQPVWELVLFDQPYNKGENNKRRLNWSNWKEVLKNP